MKLSPASTNTPSIYPDPGVVKKIFPQASLKDIEANLPFILRAMVKRNMTSVRQLIAVLATIAVEVPPFRPIEEYGKGGGAHGIYYGRGYVQLTHLRNYRAYSAYSGLDVVRKPELVLNPEIAADAMMWYWTGGPDNPDIRPYAEKADWNNVRSIVNAGKPDRIGVCWGVDVFFKAVKAGIASLSDGLDPELLGSISGRYGMGCANGGLGHDRNFTGLNPNSTGDAIAQALNIHNSHNWRTHELRATLNVAAMKDLLKLKAQNKFTLTGFGDNLDEEYKVESILITGGRTLEMELVAHKKDPNALPPLIFRQDSSASLVNSFAVPAGTGDINQRIYQAAKHNFGKSSAAGPGGGSVACAWALGRYAILPAGIPKLGAGPYGSNAVSGVIQALKQGRGVQISRSSAIVGDIWCDWRNELHIGIVFEADSSGAKTILSNSSSRAAFKWVGSVESMERYYENNASQFWRVTG